VKQADVITFDRHPALIPTLCVTLVSSPASRVGPVTDIQPPDLETRIACARRRDGQPWWSRCSRSSPPRFRFYIREARRGVSASRPTVALWSAVECAACRGSARDILLDSAYREIRTHTSKSADIGDKADLIGQSRSKPFAYPRQEAAYICRRTHRRVAAEDRASVQGRPLDRHARHIKDRQPHQQRSRRLQPNTRHLTSKSKR